MTYVTEAELETFLKLSVGTIDSDQAGLAIAIAEAELDRFLGRTYAKVLGDYEVRGHFQTELHLPGPVTTLGDVSIDGVALGTGGYRQLGSTLYRASGWGGPTYMVKVADLDHGYAVAAVPYDIKGVTLSMAARQYAGDPASNTAGAVAMEIIGGYTVQYAQTGGESGGGGLTAGERLRMRGRRWTGGAHSISTLGPRFPVHGPWSLSEVTYV